MYSYEQFNNQLINVSIKVCQQQNYTMFPTQVKSQCRTRPATTSSIRDRNKHAFFDEQLLNAQKKLKEAKQKAKLVQKQYENVLASVNCLKKSIQVVKSRTCKRRLSLMKTFEAKKLKFQEYKLEDLKKSLQNSTVSNNRKRVKVLKVSTDLQTMVNKQQASRMAIELRNRNKTQKLNRKSQIFNKKINQQLQSKLKFQKIKQQQTNLKQKKEHIDSCLHLRAKFNKYMKAHQQRKLIQSYDNMLKQISGFQQQFGPYSTLDQTFLTNAKKQQFA